MKREELDWSVIKTSTIIFSTIFLVSLGIVMGSLTFKDKMFGEYRRHKAQFASISKKYLAVDEDERIVRKYFPEFVKLYKKGVIGREHRLNWIETLRDSSERIKLPGLKYSISPQEKYSPGFSVNLGRFLLYSSSMKLNINMLHEGDLLSLIKDLSENAEGNFTISECKFDGSGKDVVKSREAVNVRAECELQWLNIRKSDGTEIKLS